MNANTTLSVGNDANVGAAGAGAMTLGALNLGGSNNIIFGLTNTASYAGNDTVNVNGALSLTGTSLIVINKLDTALQSANYPLFTYNSVSGTPLSEFTLSNTANFLTSRQQATLSNSGSTIYLDVVGSIQNLVWAGSGSNS